MVKGSLSKAMLLVAAIHSVTASWWFGSSTTETKESDQVQEIKVEADQNNGSYLSYFSLGLWPSPSPTAPVQEQDVSTSNVRIPESITATQSTDSETAGYLGGLWGYLGYRSESKKEELDVDDFFEVI